MIEGLGHALQAISWLVAVWCILSGFIGTLVGDGTSAPTDAGPAASMFLAGFLVPIFGYAAPYLLTGRKRAW